MLSGSIFGKKILAIYRCGSAIYAVEGAESDQDFTVILEDYNEIITYKEDGNDYFLYGVESYKRALNFDDYILEYFLLWVDNTLLAKDNLLYIDSDFVDEFNKLIKVDWDKHLLKWLAINVDYYDFCFKNLLNEKSLYNLYRIRSLMKHYEATGKFEYYLSEEDKNLIIDYKNRQANLAQHQANFKQILEYLKTFLIKEE